MGAEFFFTISFDRINERKRAAKSIKISSVVHARMNFCIIGDQG